MKIINAVWEKRNLNLETTEVVVEAGDALDLVEDKLATLKSEYVVVKLPPEQIGAAAALRKQGYTFVETMIHSEHFMRLPELDEQRAELLSKIEMVPVEEFDWENIFAHIRRGLYHTDRISLDPYFTKGIANERYIGWLQDERCQNMAIYQFLHQGETFGYVGLKKLSEGVFQDVLNGIYQDFQGRGLSFSITYKCVQILKPQGCQRLEIDVSSNNLPSLKRCQRGGYQIAGFSYVFVKHNLTQEAYLARIRRGQ